MKYDILGITVWGLAFFIGLAVILTVIVSGMFLMKAIIRYLNSGNVRKEKRGIKKSLGEVLRQHREESRMTQEFVAESIGVSRQAVSKWENGISDPSTSSIYGKARVNG